MILLQFPSCLGSRKLNLRYPGISKGPCKGSIQREHSEKTFWSPVHTSYPDCCPNHHSSLWSALLGTGILLARPGIQILWIYHNSCSLLRSKHPPEVPPRRMVAGLHLLRNLQLWSPSKVLGNFFVSVALVTSPSLTC